MNEWLIFKFKWTLKVKLFINYIKSHIVAQKIMFDFWRRYRKKTPAYKDAVFNRYLSMYEYKRGKKESFDRFLSQKIAEASDRTGLQQHELRYMFDRIFDKK